MQEPKISPFCPLQKWTLKVPCLESHGHMDPEVEGASQVEAVHGVKMGSLLGLAAGACPS